MFRGMKEKSLNVNTNMYKGSLKCLIPQEIHNFPICTLTIQLFLSDQKTDNREPPQYTSNPNSKARKGKQEDGTQLNPAT